MSEKPDSAVEKPSDRISDRTGVSIRLVAMLLCGCVAATVSYSALWWKINNLETLLESQVKTTGDLTRASAADLAAHAEINATIKTLAADLKRGVADRWSKNDDWSYMMTYSRINNLSMAPHARIAAVVGVGDK